LKRFLFFLPLAFLFLADFSFGALKEYILRPGDVIQISVVDHEEFTQRTKIRPDGRINYPVIGEIDVAGLSSAKLVKLMEEKLAPYINNVVVSVGIESYFSNKIFIIGDVNAAGEYQIFEPVDVIKAIALARGLRNSKIKEIRIIRANGDVSSVDLKKFLSSKVTGADRENYMLYPGDTMFVPEKFKINWGAISSILGIISVSLSLWLLLGNL